MKSDFNFFDQEITDMTVDEIPESSAELNEDNKEDRTYIVTEMCPYCMSEVEMRWNTDTMGFKAFCPICGQRLMLCDECRHAENSVPCDYDKELDCCHYNPPVSKTTRNSMIRMDTTKGAIIARPDPDNDGIWIDLRRPDASDDMVMAHIDFVPHPLNGDAAVVVTIWNKNPDEIYESSIFIQEIENFFNMQPTEGENSFNPILEFVCADTPIGVLTAQFNSRENPTGIQIGIYRPNNRAYMILADISFSKDDENFYASIWRNGPHGHCTTHIKYEGVEEYFEVFEAVNNVPFE